jgi:dTDP-4-amino-4,6-dideoxygalactose transaminase
VSQTEWRIQLADVSITEREREAVDEVLRSGWLSMGPRTEAFEQAFGSYLGSPHSLAVANGTAALHLAAAAHGLGPGDEVICPALTFVATAAAMRQTGATVRLADSLSLDDFSLDPEELDRLAGPRTRAVVILHYGGYPADAHALLPRARERGLLVIEDAAHALGAEVGGRRCGTLGDSGCFSFFPNKNMTTGEGGMVVLADEETAARARRLRSHAMTTLTWDRHRGHAASYDVLEVGFNYRIDELRAALGIVQLSRLDELNHRRSLLTERYREALRDGPFVVPTFGDRGQSAHHLLPVVARSREERDHVRQSLTTARIQTSVHYPAIHRFRAYEAEAPALPVAEAIADRVLTVPLHPNLTDADVDDVCTALLAAVA